MGPSLSGVIDKAIIAYKPNIEDNGWKQKVKKLFSRVWDIVCVIFKAMTLAVLLFINPTIFALSFAVGAIWDEEAKRIVNKIEHLVTTQKLFSGMCLAAGAFIALPVTLAALTIYGGLRLGVYMNSEVDNAALAAQKM